MNSDDDLDRPLWGAREIAPVIGRSISQTLYLLEQGVLPVRRVGRRWCTTKRRLRQLFDESTEAA